MGVIFFVPYIFIFLILPAATYMENLSGNDFDNLYYYSFVLIQILCPFFSIWWSLLGFREFIDGKGKEILLVYKKSILPELFLTYLLYFLHMIAVFAIYVLIFNFNYFPYLIIYTAEAFAFFFSCAPATAVPAAFCGIFISTPAFRADDVKPLSSIISATVVSYCLDMA